MPNTQQHLLVKVVLRRRIIKIVCKSARLSIFAHRLCCAKQVTSVTSPQMLAKDSGLKLDSRKDHLLYVHLESFAWLDLSPQRCCIVELLFTLIWCNQPTSYPLNVLFLEDFRARIISDGLEAVFSDGLEDVFFTLQIESKLYGRKLYGVVFAKIHHVIWITVSKHASVAFHHSLLVLLTKSYAHTLLCVVHGIWWNRAKPVELELECENSSSLNLFGWAWL